MIEDIVDASLDIFSSEEEDDVFEDGSDSDGFLSEVLHWPCFSAAIHFSLVFIFDIQYEFKQDSSCSYIGGSETELHSEGERIKFSVDSNSHPLSGWQFCELGYFIIGQLVCLQMLAKAANYLFRTK